MKCETHVHFDKRMARNSDFPAVIKRSQHIHAGERCRREMYGGMYRYRTKKEPSLTSDVNRIYEMFTFIGVFQNPNTSSEVKDNSFWEYVIKDKPLRVASMDPPQMIQ